MMNCTPDTLLELLEKHATTKAEAKRVFNIVKHTELDFWEIGELLAMDGIGRKSALLIMEVACDLHGMK